MTVESFKENTMIDYTSLLIFTIPLVIGILWVVVEDACEDWYEEEKKESEMEKHLRKYQGDL